MVRGFIISLISIFIGVSVCFAENVFSVEKGIDAYKAGNYTECENNMKAVVKNDPTSSLAYYYLALSYSKQGKKILAIKNYDKVIALKSDKTLVEMAKQGKAFIGGKNVVAIEAQIEDIEENAKSSVTDNLPKLSDTDKRQIYEQKINSSQNKPQTSNPNTPPTNDEIVNALRVLQRAGLLQNGVNGMAGMPSGYPQVDARTQQMNAMLMMMNNNNNNNNGMMNMMPFMNSSNGKMDPQMIQMMMMNQMMPNFTDTGNKNY